MASLEYDELAAALRLGLRHRGRPREQKASKPRAPKTHLHAEMVARRRDPVKSQKPEVEAALRVLATGDAAGIEELLKRQGQEVVPEQWQRKYKEEGRLYWDQFYREKTTNFFKDRHYLREELAEIMPPEVIEDPKAWVAPLEQAEAAKPPQVAAAEAAIVLLELGCAVGNGVLPLLRAVRGLFAYACDLSPVAVALLREKPEYACGRCLAFACDICLGPEQPTAEHEPIEELVPAETVDLATLIFVLSAIDPKMHQAVLRRIFSRVKPGGLLMIRDYGRGDLAQIRFAPGHWLGDDLYVRGDGTLAFFFTVEALVKECEAVGFETVSCDYRRVELTNRARELQMPRVWVQGKFRRPMS